MAESSIAAYSARYDVPARVLRVSNAYGPRQNAANGQGVVAAFLHAAAYGDPVALFDGGRALRDFVHVADVARAVVTLRPSLGEPQIVNVGGGTGYAVWQVLEIVERLTGVPTHDRSASAAPHRRRLHRAGPVPVGGADALAPPATSRPGSPKHGWSIWLTLPERRRNSPHEDLE
jgi:UDP-glucose 4-epimerase